MRRVLDYMMCGIAPIALTAGFWAAFGSCVRVEREVSPPVAHVRIDWDPKACATGELAIALTSIDDGGSRRAAAVPCAGGRATLDVPHLGRYRAEVAGGDRRRQLEVAVDGPTTKWQVAELP